MLADFPTLEFAPALDLAPGPAKRVSHRFPGERLETALKALASGLGQVVIHRETPWASITFSGARHTLSLSFSGIAAVEAGERLIAELPDHEFSFPGQLVADAQVLAVDQAMLPEPVMRVEVELLLLDDA